MKPPLAVIGLTAAFCFGASVCGRLGEQFEQDARKTLKTHGYTALSVGGYDGLAFYNHPKECLRGGINTRFTARDPKNPQKTITGAVCKVSGGENIVINK
jgi:hypothetical protein